MHRLEHLRTFGDKSCTFELTVSAQTGALAHFWRQILHFRAHRKCTDWSTGHGFGRQQCHAYAVPALPLVAPPSSRALPSSRSPRGSLRGERLPGCPLSNSLIFVFVWGPPAHIFQWGNFPKLAKTHKKSQKLTKSSKNSLALATPTTTPRKNRTGLGRNLRA